MTTTRRDPVAHVFTYIFTAFEDDFLDFNPSRFSDQIDEQVEECHDYIGEGEYMDDVRVAITQSEDARAIHYTATLSIIIRKRADDDASGETSPYSPGTG